MKLGFYITLALFLFLVLLHLTFCFFEMEKARMISKPFLMSVLSVCLFFCFPAYPLVSLSCFLCMIGDIFMLFKHRMPSFFMGAVVFACSHLLNFVQVTRCLFSPLPWYLYLSFSLLFLLMLFSGYFLTGKTRYGMLQYGFAFFHVLMLFSSVFLFMEGKNLYAVGILLGYLFCIFSDLFLDYTTHKKDIRRRDFYIMATYLLGEVLIFFTIGSLSVFVLG